MHSFSYNYELGARNLTFIAPNIIRTSSDLLFRGAKKAALESAGVIKALGSLLRAS